MIKSQNINLNMAFNTDLYGKSKLSFDVRKKLMTSGTLVPVSGRKVQSYNNGNAANDGTADESTNFYANYKDGADDYFASYGDWTNAFGFDPTQYSLSYHRCAEIRQFDDELAAQEDSPSVFATKHFAVFRFCPEETCMGYTEESEVENDGDANEVNEDTDREEVDDDDANGEEIEIVGARGGGCQSNYGEYMIEISDFLEIMKEYRQERFQSYCEYCEVCMYNLYESWLKSQGRERFLKDFSEKSWREDIEGHDLSGHRDLSSCNGIETCYIYDKVCSNDIDGTYDNYFECTEVELSNGNVVYIGPHCAVDGYTIALGVYGDEQCNEYIGNGFNIENILGKLDDNYLQDYVSGTIQKVNQASLNSADPSQWMRPEYGWCIPCKKADLMYESDADDYEINELCENLYLVSARCDQQFRSWSNKAKQSKELTQVMGLSCDFIESVVLGNYDEMGFVNLNQGNYTVNPQSNLYLQEYRQKMIGEITPLQTFGLAASIFASCILGLWAVALHKVVLKGSRGMKPRRGNATYDPNINQMPSGIMMARTRSDVSY